MLLPHPCQHSEAHRGSLHRLLSHSCQHSEAHRGSLDMLLPHSYQHSEAHRGCLDMLLPHPCQHSEAHRGCLDMLLPYPCRHSEAFEAQAEAGSSGLAQRSLIFYNMSEALRSSPRPVLISQITVLARAYCEIWWSEARGRPGVL